MDDRSQELGHEDIGRLLVRYSTPAMFAMLINALYNLVDTIFIGQEAGTLALGGLAITFPVQMLILATTMTIGVGSASVVSRSLGAGQSRHAA
ncbi:MAG: MATE family efflux transporter [Candidatus Hydrogenedentes bacterium]|jgi:Na+-driven multidrug efflux pump|nr:MATE family efflux transporter [Candidatus Hydrogenedentota bacterium]